MKVISRFLMDGMLEDAGIISHVWEDAWCTIPIIVFCRMVGMAKVDDILQQIECVCGKGRNTFRCIPKKDGAKSLVNTVNNWYKSTLHTRAAMAAFRGSVQFVG